MRAPRLPPLPACGERSPVVAKRSFAKDGRVRGTVREPERAESREKASVGRGSHDAWRRCDEDREGPPGAPRADRSGKEALEPPARPQVGRLQARQEEPIGPYVVDFVCRERRLVIEVDGGQHATDTRDAARDRWLAEHRYRVLRFWNNDVLRNTDGVLETIALVLNGEVLDGQSPPDPDR